MGTINTVFVGQQSVGQYAIQLFKYTATSSHPFTVSWVGKSTRPTTVSNVFMQIFNRTSAAWETVAVNATTPANTNIVMSFTKLSNLGNYFNGSFMLSVRVYQQVI